MPAEQADLIARLEAAAGGSRELDAEIADAIGFWPKGYTRVDFISRDRRWKDEGATSSWSIDAPAYTSSIDAALALVPGSWYASIERLSSGWRSLICPDSTRRYRAEEIANGAIAFCIAALKARARAHG